MTSQPEGHGRLIQRISILVGTIEHIPLRLCSVALTGSVLYNGNSRVCLPSIHNNSCNNLLFPTKLCRGWCKTQDTLAIPRIHVYQRGSGHFEYLK